MSFTTATQNDTARCKANYKLMKPKFIVGFSYATVEHVATRCIKIFCKTISANIGLGFSTKIVPRLMLRLHRMESLYRSIFVLSRLRNV